MANVCIFGIILILLRMTELAFSSLQTDRAGPYDLKLKLIEDCSQEGAAMKLSVRLSRLSRTSVVVQGTVIMNFTFDYNVKFKLATEYNSPNGWKKHTYDSDFAGVGICVALDRNLSEEDKTKIFEGLVGEKNTSYCHVEPGEYEINNIDFTANTALQRRIPSWTYGTYRGSVSFHSYDFSQEFGCLRLTADFVPKRKKNG